MELPEKYHGGAGASFGDTVSSITNPKIISSMAATAFGAAQNEGASNAVLQQDVKLDASGQAAAQALIGKFNMIGPAINDTITSPGNLQKNLHAINSMGLISEEGEVQAAAASAVSITVPHPRTPPACTAAAAATSCE
ncbi:hypothetical protein OIDMADRAFT_149611 [Oidiodendron maius Zn]|uniref:Uncharacterized protein n=1 Tax=Oidiodendron maius (strain Zn) TaxID=913774 RepID=A0A0C3GU75_OIDMZ|nr:hypothetical protein OIDMADRAFT_149611 [Oidiodendron maius Zn]